MKIKEYMHYSKSDKMNLNKIADTIWNMEDMPNNDNFHKTVIMVVQDLYGGTLEQGLEVWNIIEKKYICD